MPHLSLPPRSPVPPLPPLRIRPWPSFPAALPPLRGPRRLLRHRRQAARTAGFTLIELMTVLVVTGTVLTQAVPSFNSFLQRRRVEGVSTQLSHDLQWWRATAIARSDALRLAIPTVATGSGYVIHTGAAGACTCAGDAPQCHPGALALRSMCLGGDAPVRVSANVSGLLLDPRQGTVSPTASIDVASTAGGSVRHIVNIMGRERRCAAVGRFAQLPSC